MRTGPVIPPHECDDWFFLQTAVPFVAGERFDFAGGLQFILREIRGLECAGRKNFETGFFNLRLDGGVERLVPTRVRVEFLVNDPYAPDVIGDQPAQGGIDEHNYIHAALELVYAEEQARRVAPPGVKTVYKTDFFAVVASFDGDLHVFVAPIFPCRSGE